MSKTAARLYDLAPETVLKRFEAALASTLAESPSNTVLPTFFRADDIGVISQNFIKLIRLFEKHGVPLCMAVVPTWLTTSRWEAIKKVTNTSPPLWCWHQHGWSHTNHEAAGKKFEFGESRTADALKSDLVRGREKLQTIMGADFSPFFTPPWNRCSQRTLELLSELRFHGISRSCGEQKNPSVLPDIFINIDIHTRKETEPAASLDALCRECRPAVEDGHLGIMLHHQLMNDHAFTVLDGMLEIVGKTPRLQLVEFNQFLNKNK